MDADSTTRADVALRMGGFCTRHGLSYAHFLAKWRANEIPDTTENNLTLSEALWIEVDLRSADDLTPAHVTLMQTLHNSDHPPFVRDFGPQAQLFADLCRWGFAEQSHAMGEGYRARLTTAGYVRMREEEADLVSASSPGSPVSERQKDIEALARVGRLIDGLTLGLQAEAQSPTTGFHASIRAAGVAEDMRNVSAVLSEHRQLLEARQQAEFEFPSKAEA